LRSLLLAATCGLPKARVASALVTARRIVRVLTAAALFAVALTLALIPVRKSAEDVSLSCGAPIYTSFRSTTGWEQQESRREIQKLLDQQ
jgi:hypothetical protein